MSDPIVGIDLGTSNTVVAYAEPAGTVRVLADDSGSKIHPSVVSFHPSGGVVVGAAAKQRKVIDPKNTIYSVKRLIGRSYNSPEVQTAKQRMPYQIKEGDKQLPKVVTRGGEFAIPEISAIVLDHARNIASAQLQTEVNRAVVTVPASFNDAQRSATATAGSIAGLTIVRVLNEPTAAALAYGHLRNLREVIAVYDFGGGTFDITILKLDDQVYEVLGTAGDSFLGGDDLDERLVDRMVEKFLMEHRIDLRSNEVSMMRLRAVAEQTKIELSRRARAVVRIDEIAYGPSGKALDLQIEITRDEFVKQVADIIDRTFPVCKEAMALAGIGFDRIEDVILVGGTSKIPYVRDQVGKFFSKPPRTDVNPEEAVAVGAALQATALERILSRRPSTRVPIPAAVTEPETSGDGDRLSESSITVPEGLPSEVRAVGDEEPTSTSGPKRMQTTGFEPLRPRPPALDPRLTERPAERGAQVDRIGDRIGPGAPGSVPPQAMPLGRITKPQGSSQPAGAKTVLGVAAAEPSASPRTSQKASVSPPPAPTAIPTPIRTQPSVPVQRPPAPASRVPVAPPQAATLMVEPAASTSGFGGETGFPDLTTNRVGHEPTHVEPTLPPQTTARGFQAPQTYPIAGGLPAALPPTPVVMDVTPRGLGIGTVAGYCEELIRRNARIPAETRKLFTTSRDHQDLVRIIVCQGESRRLDNNTVIGDLVLADLPRRPRGETSIEVTFMLDASGILQVRARDPQTGKEQRASIEVLGNVSQSEVAASRDRLQALRR